MSYFHFYHGKSQEIPLLAWTKYPWLSHWNLSNESIEARYYLLEYLSESYGFSGELEQESNGKPLPIIISPKIKLYWSISHSENYIAGIVSIDPTGIDIAEYSERHYSLLDTHSTTEYDRIGSKDWRNFYRLWTGKEAIIKKMGAKLDDMKNISFLWLENNLDYIFEFHSDLHKIRCESTDTVILAYIAP